METMPKILVVMGLGVHGYILGLEAALHLISQKAG
jgi:hypothetical protein